MLLPKAALELMRRCEFGEGERVCQHAFTVSNAYMHEAIKRSDRAHAINFGKLYFEIYGNAVDRSELVEIFENWNIASESAFSKIKIKDQDVQVVEQIKELVKVIKLAEGKES